MHAFPDHWPGEPRYSARLEVHLDARTQTTITRFMTAFRRSRSAVLRYVLQWGLMRGQGWTLERCRPPARAQRVSLRLEPEVGIDGRAADAQPPGDGSHWDPRRMERVQSFINRDSSSVPGRPLGWMLHGLGALAPSLIHRCDRDGVPGAIGYGQEADCSWNPSFVSTDLRPRLAAQTCNQHPHGPLAHGIRL
jgi:hypothetical protein